MKYTILGFNQRLLLEKYPKFDIQMAVILRTLIDFCACRNDKIKKIIKDNEEYTWINYGFLIEELPIIKITTKQGISQRIALLKKWGLIKTFKAPENSIYFRLTEKVDELIYEGGAVNDNLQGVNDNLHPPVNNNLQHNPSTNSYSYSYINNNNNNNNNISCLYKYKQERANARSPVDKINLEEEINKLITSNQKHLQIIGVYLKRNKPVSDTWGAFRKELKRHLRAARDLTGYPLERIEETMDFCEQHAQKLGYLYTLETVGKFIDNFEKMMSDEEAFKYMQSKKKKGGK